jgi:RluA family pseudouridine synthase
MEPDREQGGSSDHREAASVLRVEPARAGMRADAFLFHQLPFVSRTRVRQKIQAGESLLNGHRFSTATRLRAGDEVRIWWRNEPREQPAAALSILFEDDHLLAADKPAGMAAHPMGGRQAGTLVQAVRERYRERTLARLEQGDASFYPTLVNRLDVPTSGIVLFALTRGIHKAMQAMSTARLIEKEYAALVEGVVDGERGLIDLPIGPCVDARVRLKMGCRTDGKESRTRWEVIERLPAHTLLRVFPLTGRQHQLRVHLAAIGHPIVGDLLYKDERLFLAALGGEGAALPPRLCLHARRAAFDHPVGGGRVVIESVLPADFLTVLQELRL